MDTVLLVEKFARMGARLRLGETPNRRFVQVRDFALDVRSDRHGEYFEITRRSDANADAAVLDVQPADRHLLLMVRNDGTKDKFLCGHDERHWFVAAIPETASVGTVRQAKESLKPAAVRDAQDRIRLRGDARELRKNAAYIRQGEWFFIPTNALVVDPKLIIRNEPLVRSTGGKPHRAEFCYRSGGQTVYVCSRHPTGMTPDQHRRMLSNNPSARNWNWRAMRQGMAVYVRGRIRHSDHKTVMLHGWHQVVMNTENQARAMRNVVFLD